MMAVQIKENAFIYLPSSRARLNFNPLPLTSPQKIHPSIPQMKKRLKMGSSGYIVKNAMVVRECGERLQPRVPIKHQNTRQKTS